MPQIFLDFLLQLIFSYRFVVSLKLSIHWHRLLVFYVKLFLVLSAHYLWYSLTFHQVGALVRGHWLLGAGYIKKSALL